MSAKPRLLMLIGLFLSLGAAPPPARPLADRHGDPLPEGALARFGTVRLRQGGLISQAVLSRDGKLLLTAGHDRIMRLWDARTGKALGDFASANTLHSATLSGDGGRIAYCTGWELEILDARTGKKLQTWSTRQGAQLDTGTYYSSLAFSPDGKHIAGSAQEHTRVWDASNGQPLHTFPNGDAYAPIHAVSFSDDGKSLGTGGKTPAVWDLTTGKVRATFADHKSRVYSTALSGDGKRLAVGYEDGLIYLWNTATGKADHVLPGHKGHGQVSDLAFTGDGRTLYTTSRHDRALRRWDVAAGKAAGTHEIDVYDGINVAVSADGRTLAAAGDNHTAHVWHDGRPLALDEAHANAVTRLVFSPDGNTLASAGYPGQARVWDVASARQLAVRGGRADLVYNLAFHPDGKSLVVSNRDHLVRWCHPRTARVLRSGKAMHDLYPTGIGFRDGATLVVGFSGQMLRLAQMEPQGKTHPLTGHQGTISHLAFSADGKTMASAGGIELFVWDVATGRPQPALKDGIRVPVGVYAVALSPDGRRVAAAAPSQVLVWDVATGKQTSESPQHPHRIDAVTFSPDGRWLATSCADRTIRLWETTTWQPAGQFVGHTAAATALAFSPDGRTLASGSHDTSILMWDLSDRFAKKAEPDALWADLGGDAEKARKAIWAMTRSPKALASLGARLGVKKADPKRLDKLIRDLDDDDIDVRDRATKELLSLGLSAAETMRKALKTAETDEVKLRLIRCLSPLDSGEGRLRRLRARAALEYAGTAEARRLLKMLGDE